VGRAVVAKENSSLVLTSVHLTITFQGREKDVPDVVIEQFRIYV
jgi:hypothetical protein